MTTQHIILDKNFVQGRKAAEIIGLCASGRAVMPDVLFYEMMTSPEPARSQCFAKFPGINPVLLVPSVGELLRFELDHRQPSRKPSAHAKKDPFQFHSGLADGAYVAPEGVKKILLQADEDLATDVTSLIQMMDLAPKLFPSAFAPGADRPGALHEIESLLATQPDLVTGFYATLPVPRDVDPIDASLLTPDWAFFRWLQVKLWAALELRIRLGCLDDDLAGERRHRVENYLHDMQYVMLALLEGGLACEDVWPREAFKLFRPDGELLPDEDAFRAKREAQRGASRRS